MFHFLQNQKSKILVAILIIISVITNYECRKDKYVVPVCYDTDVQPILTNKCSMSGCHNSVDKAAGLDLSSYAGVQASSKKDEILESINKGKMPPAGYQSLTSNEKQILARWVAQGYTKGECSSNSVACDTTNVTYTNSIKAIFDNNCTGCHNASNPSGGWALDTYNSSKTCAQSGRLLGTVEWLSGYSAMPQGGNKLSDCDIAKIQKWINAGMPN